MRVLDKDPVFHRLVFLECRALSQFFDRITITITQWNIRNTLSAHIISSSLPFNTYFYVSKELCRIFNIHRHSNVYFTSKIWILIFIAQNSLNAYLNYATRYEF